MDQQDRKQQVRRTALILIAVALSIYLGFIFLNVLRA